MRLSLLDRIRDIAFRVRHGFWRSEWQGLDQAVARFLAPRLRYFAEHNNSFPSAFLRWEEADMVWVAVLHKMADGFERIASSDPLEWSDEEVVYIEECLDLFREFYFSLWD